MLQIQSKPALIGIKYKQPKVNLNFHKPQGNAKIINSRINIRAEAATLEIDQTRCFEEIGLYKTGPLAQKVFADSKNKVLQGIKKMAIEGNTLARIEKNPQAIPNLAKSNFNKSKDYTVGMIPKSPPEINIQRGEFQVDLQEGSIDLDNPQWSVQINQVLAPVNIYLQQKSEINIQYLGNQVDIVK